MRFILPGLLLLLAPLARAQEWQPVATELLAKEKPGYGGLCGVLVDHATGTLYVNVSDRGVFRSNDQGKTWVRHGQQRGGRTETPGCFQLVPTGTSKQFVLALVYGKPVLIGSTDPDGTSREMGEKSAHVDWCVVDWTDQHMQFALAFKHESGGLLLHSRDGGKTFTDGDKGYGLGAWIFDRDTAVVARAKSKDNPTGTIVRTTDVGKTFSPVAEYNSVSLPKPQGDVLFWLVEGALLKGTDKGARWEKLSDVAAGRYGPVFGKDAKHLFVLTNAGILESTDGGATWAKPVEAPKELKGISALTWLEYDPKSDTLYIMKMSSDLYKLARK